MLFHITNKQRHRNFVGLLMVSYKNNTCHETNLNSITGRLAPYTSGSGQKQALHSFWHNRKPLVCDFFAEGIQLANLPENEKWRDGIKVLPQNENEGKA